MSNAIVWLLVAMIIAGSGMFIGFGIWRTYDITQDMKRERTLQNDVRVVIKELQDLFMVIGDVDLPTSCTVFVGDLEQPNQYKDSEFRLVSSEDEEGTSLQFVAALIESDSTTVLGMRNTSGVLAYLNDISEQESVFQDGSFKILHVADTDKELRFDLSNFTPQTTHTLAFQAKSGTIAYLSDIPTFTTAFSDAEFEVFGILNPTKAMRFDVSGVAPDNPRVLKAQNFSGTVAYKSDVPWEEGIYDDGEFAIHDSNDTDRQAVFNLDDVSSLSLIEIAVQSRSGEIGYISDAAPPVTVDITSDRLFPTIGDDGFSSFQDGGVTTIQIWMCGGGGGGSTQGGDGGVYGAGGGGGGGIDGLIIRNVSERFTHFDITLGDGGLTTRSSSFSGEVLDMIGGDGGTTTLESLNVSPEIEPFQLQAFGGGGGSFLSVQHRYEYGGCGGGVAGSPTVGLATSGGTSEPGEAGTFGGVPGVCGDRQGSELIRNSPFRFPWRGGTHGSQITSLWYRDDCTPTTCPTLNARCTIFYCPSGSVDGGGLGGGQREVSVESGVFSSGGAGGMFGPGGSPDAPDAPDNSCAGGGSANFDSPDAVTTGDGITSTTGRGGSGRVVIRYWTI